MKKKVLLLGSNGLAGRAINEALREEYQVIPAAGHHAPEGGYCLPVEEPGRLAETLERESPETVISAIRGDFRAQMVFHEALADWLAERGGRLLYVSTANVFDGDLSRPWTEADQPVPKSAYGVFKRDCEAMLGRKLGERLIIFRLAPVWAPGCPRIRQLEAHSRSGEPHRSYQGNAVNVTLARQVGEYAEYVLSRGLWGIFHVGTTDLVDYYEFETLVCARLGIKPPQFEVEEAGVEAYQAVLPARREIPGELQMTAAQVLEELGRLSPRPTAAAGRRVS